MGKLEGIESLLDMRGRFLFWLFMEKADIIIVVDKREKGGKNG